MGINLYFERRNAKSSSLDQIEFFKSRHFAPVGRHVSHKQLIESTKSTGQTSRQTDEPQKFLLVSAKLANNWQKIVQVERVLKSKEKKS